MTAIEVVLGDITAQDVDAIVTAANESLLGGGGYGEAAILASCYRRSLEVADALGTRSIAFPAIATGTYGFPPRQAAAIAVQAIRSTATAVGQVRLVAFDQAARDLLQAALSQ